MHIEEQFGIDAFRHLESANINIGTVGNLNSKTVKWFDDVRMENLNIYTKYIIAPIHETSSNAFFFSLARNFKSATPTSTPVFKSSLEFNAFKGMIIQHKKVLIEDFEKTYNIETAEANKYYEKFFEHYITKSTYITNFKNIPSLIKNPVVHLTGYNRIDGNNLLDARGNLVSAHNLVEILSLFGLPNKSTVKLDFCVKGCVSYPLESNVKELTDSVKAKNTEYLQYLFEDEFMYLFHRSLKRMNSNFVGKISGYWGERIANEKTNVLFLGGATGTSTASTISTQDGELALNQSETYVEASDRLVFNPDWSLGSQGELPFNQMEYLDKSPTGQHLTAKIMSLSDKKTPNDGSYIFVVPVGRPSLVLIAPLGFEYGHTSLTRGRPVYFAGEISFQNGNIEYWNNESGHYKPSNDALRFLPELYEILPKEKYNPNEHRKRLLNQ